MELVTKKRSFTLILFILYGIEGTMILALDETVENNKLDHVNHPSPEKFPETGKELFTEENNLNSMGKESVTQEHGKETVNRQESYISDSNDAMDHSSLSHLTENVDKASQSHIQSNVEETRHNEESSNSIRPTLKDITKDKNTNYNGNKDIATSEPTEVVANSDEVLEYKEDLKQNMDNNHRADRGLKKQRYSSLLYTFGVLFNSFLSEFGDLSGNQDIGYNSSEKENNNSSVPDEVLNDTSVTFNNTDSGKKTRFQCALRNVTENTILEVKIVNSTELLEILNSSKNQKVSPCVLVMFYAPWCYFCARTAPYYNALARAFPQLNILAVDTSHFSYLNARFGTVAVPNVMLFHSRSAVRYNHTVQDLDHFVQFITNNTGLEPNKSITVESYDYEGPLSSKVVQKRDWLLWLAWAFVIICSTYRFIGSLYGQAFIAKVRVLWQEHQHIE